MISTSATVFTQYPEVTVPRIARRLQSRYESVPMPENRVVLHIRPIGAVLFTELDCALRLQFTAPDAAGDFAARAALEDILRAELGRVLYTIAWEDAKSVPVPLR